MPIIVLPRKTLRFDELPLQESIRKLFEHPDFIRSESLLIAQESREWVLQQVIANLPHECIGKYSFERILLSVNDFRKLPKEQREKRLIILEHAKNLVLPECFYKGKVSGDCSQEVELDRIRPGKRGGKYSVENTVLSCSNHNRARGCKGVTQYWEQ